MDPIICSLHGLLIGIAVRKSDPARAVREASFREVSTLCGDQVQGERIVGAS